MQSMLYNAHKSDLFAQKSIGITYSASFSLPRGFSITKTCLNNIQASNDKLIIKLVWLLLRSQYLPTRVLGRSSINLFAV